MEYDTVRGSTRTLLGLIMVIGSIAECCFTDNLPSDLDIFFNILLFLGGLGFLYWGNYKSLV